MTSGRIVYVFTGGRRSRLAAARAGEDAPQEFLYGASQLEERGYAVDVLELTDLSPNNKSLEYQELLRHDTRLQQDTGFTSTSHHFVDAIGTLNQYDAIVASPESVAMGIAHFVRQGVVRPPLFLISFGMLIYSEHDARRGQVSGWLNESARRLYRDVVRGRRRKKGQAYRELLESCAAVMYFERSEYELAKRMYPELAPKIQLYTQCVDTAFWRPGAATTHPQDEVLFIGNDRERDFDLVIQIARYLPRLRFVFVTEKILEAEIPPNVTLKRGDWKKNLLSDQEVREIVQNSAMVVIPFKSGTLKTLTSVALQAMACGKTVLVSKTAGVWEPEFRDRQHLWFVRSSRLQDWCENVEALMRDAATRDRIGTNARKLVESQNNLAVLARSIEAALSQSLRHAKA